MKIHHRAVALIVVGLCVSAAAAHAVAAPKNTLVPTSSEIELPKFGFTGSTINGVGDRIATLTPGGRFAKLGVEVGDVIISVNGFALTYDGSWRDSLLKARKQGAKTLHLQIRDIRTGKTRSRDISVNFAGKTSSTQSAAQKAKLANLHKQLNALQLQAVQLQDAPAIVRDKLLQQNTAERSKVLKEIASLQH
jgi:hypothetical protein